MEIKTNRIDGANAEIEATIKQDVIDASIEKLAKELAKSATVQGFRKGKVPVSVIKKQHGDKIVQDAEGEALREVLDAGLKELGITKEKLIGEPSVTKYEKTDNGLEVVVVVAQRPDIDLGDYASLTKEFDKPVTSDKDVETRIKDIAQNQAPLEDIKRNRKMKDGDTAVIDFKGSIDGIAFEGGKGENFELLLGSGQFIPGFEEQLVGIKRDEEVTVTVSFPAEYQAKELAGKEAEFKVKVNGIKVKGDVEVDDELAKQLLGGQDDATVEELTKQVKLQMDSELLGKLYNDEKKPSLLESIVSSVKFDLPTFVVEQEIDMALNKSAQNMSEDEIKELRENPKKLDEMRETYRADADQSVRATFIIDALALAENVKVEEEEIMQTIYMEAMQSGQEPKAMYDKYKEAGYLPAIQMSMVEDKVLSQLLNAKIKKA